jgi:hypothetical protein
LVGEYWSVGLWSAGGGWWEGELVADLARSESQLLPTADCSTAPEPFSLCRLITTSIFLFSSSILFRLSSNFILTELSRSFISSPCIPLATAGDDVAPGSARPQEFLDGVLGFSSS